MPTNDRAQLNVRIPRWMKREAKVKAAQTGQPLNEVIQDLLEDWLKSQPKAEEKQPSK